MQRRNNVSLTPKQLQQIGAALLVLLFVFLGEDNGNKHLSLAYSFTNMLSLEVTDKLNS